MNIFSEMASIEARISALDHQTSGAVIPTGMTAAMRRSNGGGLSAPPLDPQAPARFQAMIAEALAHTGGYSGTGDFAPQTPEALEPLIQQNAAANGVDPALIKAVIANESGFNPAATSPVGAQGLMQLMPATAAGLGVQNSYDPVQNIAGGTRYLRSLYDRFGDWKLAVAAYNAGPEAVKKYGGVPPYHETQNYVASVFDTYRGYSAKAIHQAR